MDQTTADDAQGLLAVLGSQAMPRHVLRARTRLSDQRLSAAVGVLRESGEITEAGGMIWVGAPEVPESPHDDGDQVALMDVADDPQPPGEDDALEMVHGPEVAMPARVPVRQVFLVAVEWDEVEADSPEAAAEATVEAGHERCLVAWQDGAGVYRQQLTVRPESPW